MELTTTFSGPEYEQALESWTWLPVAGKAPLFCSLFGDVVLEDGSGFWFLDHVEGSLQRMWGDRGALDAALASEEGRDRFLLGGLAMAAAQSGLILDATQVYSFATPPVLGGGMSLDQVEVMDFVVAINLAGQLHQQVKDLEPGTRVTGFEMEQPPPPKRKRFGRRR